MSNFIHSREYLEAGDVVVVDCDHQCNVCVTDDANFSSYRRGQSYRYLGGFYQRLPTRIVVSHSDHWNVTIDLGGRSANIRYSINYLKAAA